MTEIGSRWDTPERLSTRLSSRAEERELLDDFSNVIGQVHFDIGLPVQPCLAARDFNTVLECNGIMRADFAADAVFKRRNNLPARRGSLPGWL